MLYLTWQEGIHLPFLATIDHYCHGGPFLLWHRDGFCHDDGESWNKYVEHKLIKALDVQPGEEVVVTFMKREKS